MLEQNQRVLIVCLCAYVEGDVHSGVVLIFIEEPSGSSAKGIKDQGHLLQGQNKDEGKY